MALALRPGLSFCEIGDRLVFLDIRADRYFGLAPDAEHAFRELMAAGAGRDYRSSAMMGDALFVSAKNFCVEPCPLPPRATGSLIDAPFLPALPHRLSAITALARMHVRLRLRGLGATVEAVRSRQPEDAETMTGADKIRTIAAAFEASARVIRSHDRCLVRSLATAQALFSNGIAASLVIGVRLRPFAAHSWVQHDQTLVNDRPDNVRSYTPILLL